MHPAIALNYSPTQASGSKQPLPSGFQHDAAGGTFLRFFVVCFFLGAIGRNLKMAKYLKLLLIRVDKVVHLFRIVQIMSL
jgi:hypothetical protein